MDYNDDDIFAEDEDWVDPDTRRAQLERALELVDLLTTLLQATATRMDKLTAAEKRNYRDDQRSLAGILKPLGISHPYHWPTLEQGLAATKDRNYHGRRAFYAERAAPVIEQIQSRLDDAAAGDIAAALSGLDDIARGTVADAAAIRLELRRIEIALPTDPSAAIGKAKNVVEATAKAVLSDLGQPAGSGLDVPGLVSAAMKALGIDNASVVEHDRALAKLMSQLSGLAQLLAVYRNKAGDGHAYEELPAGLDLRHGRLAVRAAVAWAAFMLDTLHDLQGSRCGRGGTT